MSSRGPIQTVIPNWRPLEDGKDLAVVRFNRPKIEFDPDFDISPCVAIWDYPLLTGETNVVSLLHSILQEVAATKSCFNRFLVP